MSKEKPILFSTEMVQAILDGRKTETRRVIKPQPELTDGSGFKWKGQLFGDGLIKETTIRNFARPCSPYGYKGDLLYVRESFCPDPDADSKEWDKNGLSFVEWSGCGRKVSELPDALKTPDHCIYKASWNGSDLTWKPSIHMPKKASRSWLKVKELTVERVQEISIEDIKSEGIQIPVNDKGVPLIPLTDKHFPHERLNKKEFKHESLFRAFWISLWNSINESRGYGWDENPWVWVVKFELISTTGRPEWVS